jgi:hypothetical protein
MSNFQDLKLAIVNTLGLARDGLHIYVGVLAFFASVLLLRRSARSFTALLPGLVLALLVEAIDLRDDIAGYGYPRWGASLHDLWNTMLIPIALVLLARRGVFCERPRGAQTAISSSQ